MRGRVQETLSRGFPGELGEWAMGAEWTGGDDGYCEEVWVQGSITAWVLDVYWRRANLLVGLAVSLDCISGHQSN